MADSIGFSILSVMNHKLKLDRSLTKDSEKIEMHLYLHSWIYNWWGLLNIITMTLMFEEYNLEKCEKIEVFPSSPKNINIWKISH